VERNEIVMNITLHIEKLVKSYKAILKVKESELMKAFNVCKEVETLLLRKDVQT
jgi:hypothetical protein